MRVVESLATCILKYKHTLVQVSTVGRYAQAPRTTHLDECAAECQGQLLSNVGRQRHANFGKLGCWRRGTCTWLQISPPGHLDPGGHHEAAPVVHSRRVETDDKLTADIASFDRGVACTQRIAPQH